MNVKCAHQELKPIEALVPNPRNANQHPQNQIDLLAKIMHFQGVRHPIIVSKRSGFVVAGHARLKAAQRNGWTEFPTDYQDFDSDAQEYAFLVSDNTIQEFAETNRDAVREVLAEMPELQIEMLAMPNLIMPELEIKEAELDENLEVKNKCPSCEYEW